MSSASIPAGLWPWLAVAGLGLYHGLNPAMGWLFAVALGLNRNSERVVWLALIPIALGHALAVAIVLVAVLAVGLVIDPGPLQRLAGVVLLGWAAWHAFYGRRHKVRVGMQTSLGGLCLWSFLMANAHGAGLMLIPAVIPLCLAASSSANALTSAGSLPVAFAALGLHTGVMLATTGVVALIVYRWVGLAFLRRGWINLDLLWTLALVLCGAILIVV